MLLVANNTFVENESIINASGTGCFPNEGLAPGPFFASNSFNCHGNGGSNGGYGGIGLAL